MSYNRNNKVTNMNSDIYWCMVLSILSIAVVISAVIVDHIGFDIMLCVLIVCYIITGLIILWQMRKYS